MSTKIQLSYGNSRWSAFLPELKDRNGDNICWGSGETPEAALFDCLLSAERILTYWQKERA